MWLWSQEHTEWAKQKQAPKLLFMSRPNFDRFLQGVSIACYGRVVRLSVSLSVCYTLALSEKDAS